LKGVWSGFNRNLIKLSSKEYVNAFIISFEYTKPKLAMAEVKNITPPDREPRTQIIMDGKEISLKIKERKGGTPQGEAR